jgi:hypothetical protein
MSEACWAVCATCGMPVRVIWDDAGKIAKVLAVCGHVFATDIAGDGAAPREEPEPPLSPSPEDPA